MLKIIPIPAFKDNYIWLIVNTKLRQALVVDPGEARSVINFLMGQNLALIGIFITHKHTDHTSGISELLQAYPNISVYANQIENIQQTTHFIKQNDVILINKWTDSFRVIDIPGHTLGHVAYYSHPILFTGDTLFAAGCGRLFEGTPEQMLSSLTKLANLPDDTLIYCGHEYTLANLEFALHVEPDNQDILRRIEITKKLRLSQYPSLPSTIELEKKTNPFLRCKEKNLIFKVENYINKKLINTVKVFQELREWKNNYSF